MTATPKTVLELLQRARARIASRRHWTQGWAARNAEQLPTRADDFGAVAWCAWGALAAESGAVRLRLRAYALLDTAAGMDTITLNDTESPATAHRRVLAAYDAAIQKAGG